MIFKNVELMWCFVHPERPRKNEKAGGRLEWQCMATTLDKATAKAMKDFGLTVKRDELDETNPGWKVNLKKRVKMADGKDAKPVEVFAADGKTPIDGGMIGNGTLASIRVREYVIKSGEFKGTKGFELTGIQVLKLVKYEPREEEGFDVAEMDDTGEAAAGMQDTTDDGL